MLSQTPADIRDIFEKSLAMARMAEELSQMLGRSVDLHTAAELHPSFRQQVLAEAQTEYVAA